MVFYRRNLPHWQLNEAEYLITFRIAGSLPIEALEEIASEKTKLGKNEIDKSLKQRRIFAKYEDLLAKPSSGPKWLSNKNIADIVCEALHYRDENKYDLYAFCIMPNHVHVAFRLLYKSHSNDYPVTKLLQELKRYTAQKSNKILKRSGQFWQHESFDRVIRNQEERENTIKYILNNPVKAGLAEKWSDWPYNYCKPEFIETLE